NNIVLIDTYQEYSKYMPRLEAISRTAQARIRPVLLTSITTMAGLAPMMFGLSIDFINGGYSIDSPTALWWKQLATAVVFGLGIATVLTLIFTPSMLALRVWISMGAYRSMAGLRALSMGSSSQAARDQALRRATRKIRSPEILWDVEFPDEIPVEMPEDSDHEDDLGLADLKRILQIRSAAERPPDFTPPDDTPPAGPYPRDTEIPLANKDASPDSDHGEQTDPDPSIKAAE
ncbi:MAG: efflux RND transporter permease subunit, partial [Halocynthiibacter sp.]